MVKDYCVILNDINNNYILCINQSLYHRLWESFRYIQELFATGLYYYTGKLYENLEKLPILCKVLTASRT